MFELNTSSSKSVHAGVHNVSQYMTTTNIQMGITGLGSSVGLLIDAYFRTIPIATLIAGVIGFLTVPYVQAAAAG